MNLRQKGEKNHDVESEVETRSRTEMNEIDRASERSMVRENTVLVESKIG